MSISKKIEESRAVRERKCNRDARKPTTEGEAVVHCEVCQRPFRSMFGFRSYMRIHEGRGQVMYF